MLTQEELNQVSDFIKNGTPKTKRLADYAGAVKLSESIASIKKSSRNRQLNELCESYLSKLKSGYTSTMLAESFITEASQFGYLPYVNDRLTALTKAVNENRKGIELHRILSEMKMDDNSSFIAPLFESLADRYLATGNASDFVTKLKPYGDDLYVMRGMTVVSTPMTECVYTPYVKNSTKNGISMDDNGDITISTKNHTAVINEHAVVIDGVSMKSREDILKSSNDESFCGMVAHLKENYKAINQDNLLEHVSYAKKQSKKEKKNDCMSKLALRESINAIKKSSRNKKLSGVCDSFIEKLDNGVEEYMLAEAFVSAVAPWNYLNATDTQLSALASRIDKYSQEISLSKILKTMSESSQSYYIVPLIEGVVKDYIEDKGNINKRAILMDRLRSFEFDPFVSDMLQAIRLDNSIKESINLSNIQNARRGVSVEKIFSPVLYVKENECVFNVGGSYYNRKGNNIIRLSNSNISKLDESFVKLCNVLNSSYVSISESGEISIVDNLHYAKINEGSFQFDGKQMNNGQWENAMFAAKMANDDVHLYEMVDYVKSNYDNIASVDFAKRVRLNENSNMTVDIFRVKKNLFVTTGDGVKETFYSNINPIQTTKIINEHMNLNVSSLFEDLSPNQAAVKSEIKTTVDAYEKYITALNAKVEELRKVQEGASDEDASDIAEAIKLVEDEIEKTKSDFQEYQDTADDFMNAEPGEESEPIVMGVSATYNDEGEYGDGETGDDMGMDAAGDDFGVDADDMAGDDFGAAQSNVNANDVEEPLGGDVAGTQTPQEYDGLFDETPAQTGTAEDDQYAPKIVKVSYATNIKTGEVTNSGEVHMFVPSVNGNGDVTQELQKITFSLDTDRKPVINNEYMPVTLYNLVLDAIVADPVTPTVNVDAVADVDVDGSTTPTPAQAPVTEPAGNVALDAADAIDNGEETELNPDTLTGMADGGEEGDANPIDVAYGTEDLGSEEGDEEEMTDDDIFATDDDEFGDAGFDDTNTDFDDEVDDLDFNFDVDAEDDDVDDLDTDDDEEIDVEPEEDAPQDLEAAGDSHATSINVSFDDLRNEDVDARNLVSYFDRNHITYRNMNGGISFVVRNSEECNLLKAYFVNFVGWSDSDFFNFFTELSVFEGMQMKTNVIRYSSRIKGILESRDIPFKVSKKGDKLMIPNSLIEGVTITVEDTETHKKVTINTDELNDDNSSKEDADNTNGEVDFGDNGADSDEQPEVQGGEEEGEEGGNGGENESSEGGSNPKKYTLKVKKHKEKDDDKDANESLGVTAYTKSLTETIAKRRNANGNVVSKMNDGDILVEGLGNGKVSQIKVVTNDSNKQLNEHKETNIIPSSGECCIVVNGMRISPMDTRVADMDAFMNAKPDDEVDVIIEGKKSTIAKNFVRLLS